MSQPPLKALHYFCTAAQHLSFKKAALELSVTAGAVSQQVKLLENWLGLSLFVRNTRQVELTEAGSSFYRRIAPLMSELLGVTQSMQRINRSKTVRLTLPPSFAMACFGPRVADFRQKHPDIELQLNVSTLIFSLDESSQELAIRYLPQADETLDCTLVAKLEVFPVCSPAYLEAHPEILQGDLRRVTLIHDHLHQDWHRYGAESDLKIGRAKHLYFDHAALALQAAESGTGITLSDSLLSQTRLAEGRLLRPLELAIPSRRHLFLAHSRNSTMKSAAVLVKQWVLETFGEG